MNSLEVSNLVLRLRGRILIGPLSFAVAPDRPTTIMGPSGCGKSSLLNWLIGMLPAPFAAQGSVRIGGRALDGLPPEQRRLGILFQDDLLFPHLTVEENLAFGLPARIKRPGTGAMPSGRRSTRPRSPSSPAAIPRRSPAGSGRGSP